jgi:hypothetical protein
MSRLWLQRLRLRRLRLRRLGRLWFRRLLLIVGHLPFLLIRAACLSPTAGMRSVLDLHPVRRSAGREQGAVDQFDLDPAVLHSFRRVGDFNRFACGGVGIGERATRQLALAD